MRSRKVTCICGMGLALFQGSLTACVLFEKKETALPGEVSVAAVEDYELQVQASEASEIHANMARRREAAWKITQESFTPVEVRTAAGDRVQVPKWSLWYTTEDFSIIYKSFLESLDRKFSTDQPPSVIDVQSQADETLRVYRRRELNLAARAIQEDLSQFSNPLSEATREAAERNAVVGRGFMLFSPSLIRHYLVNHDRVRSCRPDLFPAAADPKLLRAAVRPRDPDNKYAMCFDSEFPADAVMIKAVWSPAYRDFRKFHTDAEGLKVFWADDVGNGRFHRTTESLVKFDAEKGLHLHNDGTDWVLSGLHISTKEVPEWMWVSLWWAPDADEDFGADRPDSLVKQNPYLAHYKMCVASTFRERDPDPGAHFRGNEKTASLAAALDVNAKNLDGYQWCANPFLENGFAKSNCVGCHMAAGDKEPHNFPHTYTALRGNGLADFLQSFNTFKFLMGGKSKVNSGARSSTQLPDE